ncbi:MAG: general secretion pathway protein GspB, partial [Desulfurivibrionaceae bacterium]
GGQAVPPKQPEKIRLIAKTLPMNAPKVPEIAEPTVAAGPDDLGRNDAVPASEDDFDREFSEQPFDDFREDDARPTVSHADLPANIRNALPDLGIAAHYYSKTPSARMASINGRIMREGHTIGQGLTLEEITEEGVVFSSDKYRFSLKVFNR